MLDKSKTIVIGSYARWYWGADVAPKDIDVLTCDDNYTDEALKHHLKEERYSFKDIDSLKVDVLKIPSDLMEMIKRYNDNSCICGSLVLPIITLSHLSHDINWVKHFNFIQKTKMLGVEPSKLPVFKALQDFWKDYHGDRKKGLSLNKTKEEFFNDGVHYEYEHDYLHTLVTPSKDHPPLFLKAQKGKDAVKIDKDLWNDMSHTDKLDMIREEIKAISIERFLIPTKFEMDWRVAYMKAFKKIFTSLTKGWFTNFCLDNIKNLAILPKDPVHVRRFLLESDFVERFKPELNIQYKLITGETKVNETYLDFLKDNIQTIHEEVLLDAYYASRNFVNLLYSMDDKYEIISKEGAEERDSYGNFIEVYYTVLFKEKSTGIVYKVVGDVDSYGNQSVTFEDAMNTMKEVKPVEKTIVVYE